MKVLNAFISGSLQVLYNIPLRKVYRGFMALKDGWGVFWMFAQGL